MQRWLQPAPHVVTTQLDGRWLLIDVEKERIHVLNHTGSLIWTLAQAGASRQEVVNHLVVQYGIPESTAHEDLRTFVDTLAAHGLLDHPPPS